MVGEARMMQAAETITLVGTVAATRRSRVASELAGIVAEMPVRQGDFVPADGILCKLDDRVASLRVAEAKARLGALSARHQEWLAGTRPEELARLKAVWEETTADYERRRFELERVERLREGRESHDKEYSETRAEYLAAERRRAAAAANYEMGVNGPRKETLAHAAHEVAEQQAVVDRLERELHKTVIRTPFSGYIVARLTEIGEWVGEGGPIVEMADISSVLVGVDVPESAIAYAAVDAPARVQVDALRKSFSGTIRHVIRQGDERARTFPVEVEVPNPDVVLAGGMFARVTVPSGPVRSVLGVPKDAILERDGMPYVALVVPGAQGDMAGVLVPVVAGAEVGEWTAVTSGNIQPGMRVITHGNERMEPFPMPVLIVDEAGNPVTLDAGPKNPDSPKDAPPAAKQGT